MADGSGGVQQWVIGLADALSALDTASEEYVFLVIEDRGAWLSPHIAGRSSVLVQPPRLPAAPEVSSAQRERRARRTGLFRFRLIRRIRRRLLGPREKRKKQEEARQSPFDRMIRAAGADLMHFTWPSASSTTVPSIYQPWDLQHVHLPEFFSPEARENREKTYRTFCAQAARIVVATRWVRDDVAAHFGIAPEKIAVVNPPPVTVAYEPPTAEEEAAIAARLGLPARFAFYPAQTWGHKNHERLLEALRQLRDRGIEVPLVCSGLRNERYPALQQGAAELGVDGQVSFLGFVTPTEIQVLYRRATMLVFPSLYEGWGLPIIEAFAADLPVACSNATSLPALVGDAALVFDPTDADAIAAAIGRLWTDPGLRGELVVRGRARSAQFDWARTARLMRAHYRQLAGRRLDAEDRRLLAAEPLV